MLEFIMDRNVLLYVLAAACVVGVVSQLILKQVYAGLIRDTRKPSGRFLVQLRQRFQYCTHLNEKVGDVQALIRRNLMEYRFWGMNLHQWKRIGLICLAVSVLCAFAGTMSLWHDGSELVKGNTYFWTGLLAAALTAAAYGISDTGEVRRQHSRMRRSSLWPILRLTAEQIWLSATIRMCCRALKNITESI